MNDTRENRIISLLTNAQDDLLLMWKRYYSSSIFSAYQINYNKVMSKIIRIMLQNDYVICE